MVSGVSSCDVFGESGQARTWLMGTRRRRIPSEPRKSLELTAHPHIVSEVNKLQEGYWRKKTTRLEPILPTRQGTLESVWLWVVDA